MFFRLGEESPRETNQNDGLRRAAIMDKRDLGETERSQQSATVNLFVIYIGYCFRRPPFPVPKAGPALRSCRSIALHAKTGRASLVIQSCTKRERLKRSCVRPQAWLGPCSLGTLTTFHQHFFAPPLPFS